MQIKCETCSDLQVLYEFITNVSGGSTNKLKLLEMRVEGAKQSRRIAIKQVIVFFNLINVIVRSRRPLCDMFEMYHNCPAVI